MEGAFARAALVVEGNYSTPRVHQGYIEPRACLASVDEQGGFHVVSSTQNPFGVRATLCSVLGLPESRVRVSASTVGGGFGCAPLNSYAGSAAGRNATGAAISRAGGKQSARG